MKQDKSALGFEQPVDTVGTNYQKVKPDVKSDIKSLKNRFENVSPQEEARKKAEEIRQARLNKDKLEREQEEKKNGGEKIDEKPTKDVKSADLANLNTVSSSPFRQQQQQQPESNESPNSSSNSNSGSRNPAGVGKIKSHFLQTGPTLSSKQQQPFVVNGGLETENSANSNSVVSNTSSTT